MQSLLFVYPFLPHALHCLIRYGNKVKKIKIHHENNAQRTYYDVIQLNAQYKTPWRESAERTANVWWREPAERTQKHCDVNQLKEQQTYYDVNQLGENEVNQLWEKNITKWIDQLNACAFICTSPPHKEALHQHMSDRPIWIQRYYKNAEGLSTTLRTPLGGRG